MTYLSRRHLGTRDESTLRLDLRVVKGPRQHQCQRVVLRYQSLSVALRRDGASAPHPKRKYPIRTLGSLRPYPNPTIVGDDRLWDLRKDGLAESHSNHSEFEVPSFKIVQRLVFKETMMELGESMGSSSRSEKRMISRDALTALQDTEPPTLLESNGFRPGSQSSPVRLCPRQGPRGMRPYTQAERLQTARRRLQAATSAGC